MHKDDPTGCGASSSLWLFPARLAKPPNENRASHFWTPVQTFGEIRVEKRSSKSPPTNQILCVDNCSCHAFGSSVITTGCRGFFQTNVYSCFGVDKEGTQRTAGCVSLLCRLWLTRSHLETLCLAHLTPVPLSFPLLILSTFHISYLWLNMSSAGMCWWFAFMELSCVQSVQ